MNALREILSISKFKPERGPLLDLYQIIVLEKMERKDAEIIFKERRKKGSFRVNYTRLRDKALKGLLHGNFGKITKSQSDRILVFLRYTQVKILFHLDKKDAFCSTADSLLNRAKSLGLFELGASIARSLRIHYVETEPNKNKFEKYNKAYLEFKKSLEYELAIEEYYCKVILALKTKKLTPELFANLFDFSNLIRSIYDFRFRLYYYILVNIKADYFGDDQLFMDNTRKALSFFEQSKVSLPYTMRWTFLINLLPIYLSRGEYIESERTINACLSLPTRGSYNWHLTLLYKAMYGFHSDKPAIALNAWQKAREVPKKFSSSLITERWQIIEAYLSFYHKIGKLNFPKSFKLYRFLNRYTQGRGETNQKANLIILEFLHLLVDNKLKIYTDKTFKIDGYIARDFNTQKFRRTKYFLRALRSILRGNFHSNGAARHATSNLSKMYEYSNEMDLSVLDREVVPYEILWKELINILKIK